MAYIILDLEAGNMVDSFTSEEAALDEVRATVIELGADAARPWALLARDPSGQREAIAAGDALIQRAFAITA